MKDTGTLRIAGIQPDVYWEDREKNLAHLDELIGKIPGETDMIVLPEMFSTGFTMAPEKCSDGNPQEIPWMQQQSDKHNTVIVGSYIAKTKNQFRNRLAFVAPGDVPMVYDKRHLFRMGEEDKHYVPGNRLLEVTRNGWRIKPFICYDLRFPVWISSGSMADLLIFIANWPSPRREVWLTLLKARAIENQAYVIGVNRTGKDGRGIVYSGDTVIIDPKGIPVSSASSSGEEIVAATLDKSSLIAFRDTFPAYLDADRFQILT